MSVLAAIILCDRKASSQLVAVPSVIRMQGIDEVYVNVETEDACRPWPTERWQALDDYLNKAALSSTVETWCRSGWFGSRPRFDQDQRRLIYIVAARNMAIDYAVDQGYDWLLFVDADVVPRPDGLEHLLSLEKVLCGGYVPGRGAHSHLHYVFASPDQPIEDFGDVIRCGHGTCGYMLIHHTIFERLRFRYGPHPTHPEIWLSEDPAYCADAIHLGLTDAFYVHKRATALHWDDPDHPLTQRGTAQY